MNKTMIVICDSEEHIALVNHRQRYQNGLWGWITFEKMETEHGVTLAKLMWTQF